MQTNATLQNERQATVAQINAFIRLLPEHGNRILNACIENGFMKVNYSTKSGYFFVQIIYNQYGNEIERKHFKDWDDESREPINQIKFYE